ncbi:hypothetical protein F0562_021992 [Nyssa sinensis]|uniref:PWI domain-containing protein n=1 Tax=Nyssa sinensis TaxID=561372 RepID=A0A5J5BRM3_9ASTE|nr:hypothetical protein F0562_021992 [Nyssa sinensis]
MDVMRPWIASRVTELLGFEDEVLINFIYGLLDGKEVNGKEVQISLTGFMEKNTGKFMKELWTLLLSAQKNASGVPQPLLDAKEEETRKKKAETDRIANEIQKKREKEGRELEQEKSKKMDGEREISRANNAGLEQTSKHRPRASSVRPLDETEANERNGRRERSRVSRSLRSADRPPSSPRGTPSRSISKSFSNSRSYSDERHKSRSVSGSPRPRGRSISSEKVHRSSLLRRSATPHRKHSPRQALSPPRRISSRSGRRSTSRSRHRSPSPVRRRLRSPFRRRSRSPMRRRSRSPVRRRSPMQRRSRSPMRHWSRSPMRRRSSSPMWQSLSPRRRSSPPVRNRPVAPVQRQSPSPIRRPYRRSPSTPWRRTPPPQEWRSPSPIRRVSPAPVRRKSPKHQRRSPMQSPRERIRTHEKFSPVRHAPPRENVEHSVEIGKGADSVSPSLLESPPRVRRKSPSEDRRLYSSYESPVKQTMGKMVRGSSLSPSRKSKEHKPCHDSLETGGEEEDPHYGRELRDQKSKLSGKRSMHSSTGGERKDSLEKVHYKDENSRERLASHRSSEVRSRPGSMDLRKKDQDIQSERTSGRVLHPEVPDQQQSSAIYQADGKNLSHLNDVKGSDGHHKSVTLSNSKRKVDQNARSGSLDAGSEESDKHRTEVNEKRKHKRFERKELASDDDYSYDSQIEERKGAKRRRKEEKRIKKEERRRRHKERRRRREERRAERLKVKSIDTATPPSDFEKNHDGYASDGDYIAKRESRAIDTEETRSEQKKLEIELREKALESLRAKKGVDN